MNVDVSEEEKITLLKDKLEGPYLDLLYQLSQIEYGEASLTCIVKDKHLAFAGVSRTKNIMFEINHKA